MECEIESYRHEIVLACDVSQARTHHSSSLLFVLAFQTQRQVCVALPDCRELRPRNQVTNHIRLGVLTIFTMTGIRPNLPFHIRLSRRAGDIPDGPSRLCDCLILNPLHIPRAANHGGSTSYALRNTIICQISYSVEVSAY